MITPKSLNSHFKKKKQTKRKKKSAFFISILLALSSDINSFIGHPRHCCITELTSSRNQHFVGIPGETLFL